MKGRGTRYKADPPGPGPHAMLLLDDAGPIVAVPIETLDALERFARRILEDYGAPTHYPGALEVLQWMRRNGWCRDVDEWQEDLDDP